MQTIRCAHCSREFEIQSWRLRRSKLLFCSVDCRRLDGRTLGRPRIAGPNLECPICGEAFYRKPAEMRATNYCSYACAAQGTGNLRPAPKGERRSPATEFAKGSSPHNRLAVGAETVRNDKSGNPRVWVKVAEPNVWRPRAIVVWERAHGPLPDGKIVHHIDEVTTNDAIDNLVALTRADHARTHGQSLVHARQARETSRSSRGQARSSSRQDQ